MALISEREKARIQELFSIEKALWAGGIRFVAGLDEAGRGPLAGPVVAAAVIFPKVVYIPGLNDSKLLTPTRREKLYGAIIEQASAVGIGEASPQEIDRLNILQASLLAMQRAVFHLALDPEHLLIDGRWELPGCNIEQKALVKGDQRCFSIAAASIIAKVYRDRIMMDYHKLYPQYGFERHKGYPTRAHIEAISEHGYCAIHRRSFNVKFLDDNL